VRVTALGGDRYRIDYIGAVTGTYDLLPAIERADGRAPEGLDAGTGSLSVEIFSQLPPNAGTDVFGLSAPGFNFSAHYTTALWTLGALWTAVPAFFLIRRAMRRTPPAAPVVAPREPTTAELLFAAVDAARTRELTADERGQLELRLLQILRRGAPEGDVAAAITALRADQRTAAVVRAVDAASPATLAAEAAAAAALSVVVAALGVTKLSVVVGVTKLRRLELGRPVAVGAEAAAADASTVTAAAALSYGASGVPLADLLHQAPAPQAAAKAAGLTTRFTGHSLRAGLVTAAFNAGVQEADIMRLTGHKSVVTLRRYRRTVDAWQGNAAAPVLAAIR
jgi:hypothetical protein